MIVDGADGLGEAVTGTLVARAVEPGAGEAGTLADTDGASAGDSACLNCGTELIGRHCHRCGQPAHVHRTVGAWWHDVAHSVLHFEGKIWRTLPLLAWRPGELTRRFVEGERARFVSPMALFLFTVFLMFALFSMLGASFVGLDASGREEAVVELGRIDERIGRMEAQRRGLAARGVNTARLDAALSEIRGERRAVAITSGTESVFEGEIDTGWARLDAGLKKANENPALLSYKLQTSA